MALRGLPGCGGRGLEADEGAGLFAPSRNPARIVGHRGKKQHRVRRTLTPSSTESGRPRRPRATRNSPDWPRVVGTPPRSPCGSWSRATTLGALDVTRSEEHTSELQSLAYLVCRLLLEKKKNNNGHHTRT